MGIFVSKLFKKRLFFISIFILTIGLSFFIYYSYFGKGAYHLPYHDSLSQDYPQRFLMSSAFSHGIFPLWNQYAKNGRSFSAPLISNNFSPIIWFFSLFGIYTYKIFLFEMLFIQFLAFLGMFFWIKSFTNKWIALYSAFCFSVSPPIVSAIPEFEVLTSMSLIPLIAFATKYLLKGSKRHIRLLVFGLWVVFTSGYLGTNIMFLPVIFLFCLIEFYFFNLKGTFKQKLPNLLKGLRNFFLAFLLFFGITNFEWIEAWHYTHFNYSHLRQYGLNVNDSFSPFDGSGGLKDIFTLFFTHNLPSLVAPKAIVSSPGVGNEIYFGLLNLIFVTYSFFERNIRKFGILLSIFMAFVFSQSLWPYNNFLKVYLLANPILRATRWHGWYNLLFVFFGITLASISIQYFYNNVKRSSLKNLIVSEFVVFLFMIGEIAVLLLKSKHSSSTFYFFEFIFFIFLIGATIMILYLYNQNFLKNKILILFFILFMGLIEFIPNSLSYLTYRDVWIPYNIAEVANQLVKYRNENFNVTTNERINGINTYITKIPSQFATDPFIDNTMHDLLKQVGAKEYLDLTKYIFYFPTFKKEPDLSKNKFIEIKKFYPNTIIVSIKSNQSKQSIIWSSPYTPFWKLKVNNYPQKTLKSPFGFTEFFLEKGNNTVALNYHPDYLEVSFFAMFLSLILCIYFLVS